MVLLLFIDFLYSLVATTKELMKDYKCCLISTWGSQNFGLYKNLFWALVKSQKYFSYIVEISINNFHFKNLFVMVFVQFFLKWCDKN